MENYNRPSDQLESNPPRMYSNRPENDSINFIVRPRATYKESYYKEILGHKRAL